MHQFQAKGETVPDLHSGIVTKWGDKAYGFASWNGDREIFFRMGDFAMPTIGLDHQVDFDRIFQRNQFRTPNIGEEIVFLVGQNEKGPKAAPWTFKSNWDAYRDLVALGRIYQLIGD